MEGIRRNPLLEALRNSVKPACDIEATVVDLIEATKQIHPGFLFEPGHEDALNDMCILLSSSGRWDLFASELGLSFHAIQCIKNNYSASDPTNMVLLAYTATPSPTFESIVKALHKLKRYDVIDRVADRLVRMATRIKQTFAREIDDANFTAKPEFMPAAPILVCAENATSSQPNSIVMESVQRAAPLDSPEKVDRYKYNKTVFLTFADDGKRHAEEIARVFRKERNGKVIGVLILDEHRKKLLCNPKNFIDNCFYQTNYVIPVLTKGYFTKVQPNSEPSSALSSMDEKFAQYIYQLIFAEYMKSGCSNLRVRCVIPDDDIRTVSRNVIMSSPTFQVWSKISEIEHMAARIIANEI